MGAPEIGIEPASQPAAETLLDAFKSISAAERRKHASVLNYWLSIRGDKEFPPLHDLDPLELSDAGPNSILLELISGGHDAEVRHLGEALRFEGKVDRIIDAPSPSMLACIAKKLPIVAISRDFLAFEDEYENEAGPIHCSMTLLPLSAGGAWVDYVYALVTFDGEGAKAAKAASKKKTRELDPQPAEEAVAEEAAPESVEETVAEDVEDPVAAEVEAPEHDMAELAEIGPDESAESESKAKPGFTKLFDNLVGLTGFYGHGYTVEPNAETAPDGAEPPPGEQPEATEPSAAASEETVAESDGEQPAEPLEEAVADAEPPAAEDTAAVPDAAYPPEKHTPVASEGALQSKLNDVRAKADEARQAKLRANAALYDGLSAAYDFALDAEDAPEEYLRLVEAEGLKIQLRSPMRPVVKLAFNGMCDDTTIGQLEAVLAWALDNELPRGALAEKIEAAGGIGPILNGDAKAA